MSVIGLRYHSQHIAVITIDNPPANRLSWESRAELIKRLDDLEADPEVRAVIVTGAGKAFTAGADLREYQEIAIEQLPAFVGSFFTILNKLESFRAPVIAAINGPTVGGGLEVALACDIRVAASSATFVAAGINLGLTANCCRLAWIVGLGRAKEMLFTGERYDAQTALAWGLITEIAEPDQLMAAAIAKAERIASRAPLSVEATKRVVSDAPNIDSSGASFATELAAQRRSARLLRDIEGATRSLTAATPGT
jgi:enoyl-CoA hydratase